MEGKCLVLFLVLCSLTGISFGCNRRSATTPTATPTTPRPAVVEEEVIQAVNAPSESHRSGGSSGARGRSGGSRSSPSSSVSPAQLWILTEELLTLDTGIPQQPSISLQGKTSSASTGDSAPNPLIAPMAQSALNKDTVRLMMQLLDNYEPQTTARENQNDAERAEENRFLDAVMETPLMKKLESFLKEKRLISGGLKAKLKDIWFTPYKRGGRYAGSSGFEHVFVGELRGGKVSGFHNWLSYMKEEKERDLDYKGYMKVVNLNGKGQIIKARFQWLNEPKPVGSIFVGTTPELEMSLYTLCFLAKPNSLCSVRLSGEKFNIQTYTFTYRNKEVIGSAFPAI